MRLGSEAQLGTSIATFSADGAGSFILGESPCENNAECVLGPEPVAGGQHQHWLFSREPYSTVHLSATQTLTLCFWESVGSPAGAAVHVATSGLKVVLGCGKEVKEEMGTPWKGDQENFLSSPLS